jgi:hypothetical protein
MNRGSCGNGCNPANKEDGEGNYAAPANLNLAEPELDGERQNKALTGFERFKEGV